MPSRKEGTTPLCIPATIRCAARPPCSARWRCAPAAAPASAGTAGGGIPQTGDALPVGLLIALAVAAAGGIAALLVLRKRRRK